MATNSRSRRLASAAARSTFLPMRPKPEIATFKAIGVSYQAAVFTERTPLCTLMHSREKSAAINWTRAGPVNAAWLGRRRCHRESTI
jgi:hypothetical protein